MASYFQSGFRAPAAATIRWTDDPGGSPSTSDFSVSAGDQWDSIDDFLADWMTQIASDLGGGYIGDGFNIAVIESNRGGVVDCTTPGDFAVTWSHTGDGTALRDWLGETGDINDTDGYEFSANAAGCFYPGTPLQSIRRATTSRPRGQMHVISGATRTQSNPSQSDVDDVDLDIMTWWQAANAASTYQGHMAIEAFVDDLHAGAGVLPRFSVFHEGEQWVCRFRGPELELVPQRVTGSKAGRLWSLQLQAVAEVTPW